MTDDDPGWLVRTLTRLASTRRGFFFLLSIGPTTALSQFAFTAIAGRPWWSYIAPTITLSVYSYLYWIVWKLVRIGALVPAWRRLHGAPQEQTDRSHVGRVKDDD